MAERKVLPTDLKSGGHTGKLERRVARKKALELPDALLEHGGI